MCLTGPVAIIGASFLDTFGVYFLVIVTLVTRSEMQLPPGASV